MISTQLQKYLDEYEESHKHSVNLTIHKIAIPFIVFHFFAMFSWITVFHFHSYVITLGEVAAVVLFVFYLGLNIKYAIYMGIFVVLCLFVASKTPVWCVLTIAVVAWGAQFLGHGVWEKKSPAFSKNLVQLLIGPIFVMHELNL